MELTLDNPSLTPFKDKVDFSVYIETYALQHGTGLLGSILQYCEDADVDLEDCVKLITPSLRDKIEMEAVANQQMKKTTAALPFFD